MEHLTHRERLLALLEEWGITPALEPGFKTVILKGEVGGVGGYPRSFVEFQFSNAGHFEGVSVWE